MHAARPGCQDPAPLPIGRYPYLAAVQEFHNDEARLGVVAQARDPAAAKARLEDLYQS